MSKELLFRKSAFGGYNIEDVNKYIVDVDAKMRQMHDASASALADATEKNEQSEIMIQTLNVSVEALSSALAEKNTECEDLLKEKQSRREELNKTKEEIARLKEANADLKLQISDISILKSQNEEKDFEIKKLNDQIADFKADVVKIKEVEKNLDSILQQAESEVLKVREEANKEAAKIIEDAKLEAARIKAEQAEKEIHQAEQNDYYANTDSILERIKKFKDSIFG